ncbi:biopolymer transporter ExbD [uncultured Kiloniella sp.]|uniref:ExbD/TolR family protein n=1 Tax=uncultured Kiloniella sp. TaxID=1133091 RepID=UPI0026099109|nr:biopolymer transporter ExbD [uncultured Kiloniella sp.]
MKIRQNENTSELTESTLPMINVVFLLLIFFMIAGSLQKTLPFNITPLKAQADIPKQETPLIIHISALGQIMVEDQEVKFEKLKTVIQKKYNSNDGQITTPQFPHIRPITIRSDQSTNTMDVIKILSLLKEMKIEQVALATIR